MSRGDSIQFEDQITIHEEIGHGGMGTVYRAHHGGVGKDVAVKVVAVKKTQQKLLQRFRNEARIASKLEHPNIVRVFKFGLQQNQAYLVMELLAGRTLADYTVDGPALDVDTLLRIFIECAEALQYAHSAGVVHRDVKPQNIILITDEDQRLHAKLTDFGIAKLETTEDKITATGAIVGTALYMSPEQFAGTKADYRSDIYSFGCVMYECVSGQKVFNEDNPFDLASRHMEVSPAAPSAIAGSSTEQHNAASASIDYVILRCLQKKPEDRYQSAGEVARDLEKIAAGKPLQQQALSSRPFSTSSKQGGSRPHRSPHYKTALYIGGNLLLLSVLLLIALNKNVQNLIVLQFHLDPSHAHFAQLADNEEALGLNGMAEDHWLRAAKSLRMLVDLESSNHKGAPAGDWMPTLVHYGRRYTECLRKQNRRTPAEFWRDVVLRDELFQRSPKPETEAFKKECTDISHNILQHDMDPGKNTPDERIASLLLAHRLENIAASKLFWMDYDNGLAVFIKNKARDLLVKCPEDLQYHPELPVRLSVQAAEFMNQGEKLLYDRDFGTAKSCFSSSQDNLNFAHKLTKEPFYAATSAKAVLKQAIAVRLDHSQNTKELKIAQNLLGKVRGLAAWSMDPASKATWLALANENLLTKNENLLYMRESMDGLGTTYKVNHEYQSARLALANPTGSDRLEVLKRAWDASLSDCEKNETFINQLLLLECADDYMRELRKHDLQERIDEVMRAYIPKRKIFFAKLQLKLPLDQR